MVLIIMFTLFGFAFGYAVGFTRGELYGFKSAESLANLKSERDKPQ